MQDNKPDQATHRRSIWRWFRSSVNLRCALFTLVATGILVTLGYRQHFQRVRLMGVWNLTSTETSTGNSSPIIFIGGVPRSGTTLMRVLLDVHPSIRCGAEGMVIKPVLEFRRSMPAFHVKWAKEAGIYPNLLDSAITNYIRQIVEGMGPPANMLCYKRPGVLLYMEYLARLFPDSKFVLMLRDGRAVAVSHQKWGKKTISFLDTILQKWMRQNLQLIGDCQRLGPKRCIIVRYELLVLYPKQELKVLTEFLGVPWDPVMLHHEELLRNSSTLNPYEPSTPQVKKQINLKALTKWFKKNAMIENFTIQAPQQCWLLDALGYLDIGQPPDYTKLPRKIADISHLFPRDY